MASEILVKLAGVEVGFGRPVFQIGGYVVVSMVADDSGSYVVVHQRDGEVAALRNCLTRARKTARAFAFNGAFAAGEVL